MTRSLSIALAAVAFLAGSPGANGAVNIFENGDFEGGYLYPSFEDRTPQLGVGSWDTMNAGFVAGEFDPGEFSAFAPGDTELRQDFFSFTTDLEFVEDDYSAAGELAFGGIIERISFWVAHPDPPATRIFVTLFYADGGSTSQTYRTSTIGWEYFDITGDYDPERVLEGISFFGNVSGRTLLDNIEVLVFIPEPGSISLLMVTIGILLFFRRRPY